MNNQTINGKQMKYVIALFLIGSILLISEASAEAKQDAWLAITIAAGAAMLLTLIHDAILRLYPGENLYQILINIFGGIFGKILCGIYVFYAIHLGMNVTNSYTGFINIINLDATPKYVIGWFAIIPCIYMVKSGLGVLGRTAKVCFTIMIFLFFIIILASIKIMDFSNIQPMFT
ncbi:MAG TPA: hypothetical protein DCP97_05150, partial [Ruminococcaceae bacterium]|nr:hypothetical protein [Oscillospiraceae bacterium]